MAYAFDGLVAELAASFEIVGLFLASDKKVWGVCVGGWVGRGGGGVLIR